LQIDSSNIEIRKIKKANLKGGTIIDGFVSAGGLINPIAAGCFMHSPKNELVAVLDSPVFPALSIIYDTAPNFPARIYANEDQKLAIFQSELKLDQSYYYSISKTILRWAIDNECELIISAAAIYDEEFKGSEAAEPQDNILAVASTKRAEEKLKNAGITQLSSGSINGIPALLLNEGAWTNFDVIVLLVKVPKEVSDFRAAATASEAIIKLVPRLSCDINSLLNEAEIMEKNLRKVRAEQSRQNDISVYR
jgi:uncharacterized protein